MAENTMPGGWSAYHDLTPEDESVFHEALAGFVGVHYTPFAVSTQVVAGMNYKYKCEASMPPSDVIWEVIIEIFKPLHGSAHIVSIIRI
ncbi:hypothetical protein CRV08_04870 [Halarcobacter ebronensis]|uniref:Uncharacterized protein n=1 Tax=Halarcobacter ebronensis TaxID=1462615 RepID=A0A4Q0YFJ5_9BACT|nr:hypothetical protein [Halarcobacter ebronensis]RXJ69340.1 hypothetical protein CRV08_04870 [Halarcobacter ebronensis]